MPSSIRRQHWSRQAGPSELANRTVVENEKRDYWRYLLTCLLVCHCHSLK